MSTLLDQMTARQDQFVELMTAWQKPILSLVSRSADLIDSSTASRLAELPLADKLPRPAEVVESQFAFVQKLLDVNHDFVLQLARALDVPDVDGNDARAEAPSSAS